MWALDLGRPRTAGAQSLFTIEGHVDMRDSGQALVFLWESAELTIADPSSLAYSFCVVMERSRETCPAPFTLRPDGWALESDAQLLHLSCLRPFACFAAAVFHITSKNLGSIL